MIWILFIFVALFAFILGFAFMMGRRVAARVVQIDTDISALDQKRSLSQ